MPISDTSREIPSARALTLIANASFVPIGVTTVILGPLLPTLSARWSLNYSQAGALITLQYLAATLTVALSGVLVSRWGFRFAIKAGLILLAVSLALLLTGPKWLGLVCIAIYGAGNGLAVPPGNLLVGAVNPGRRSAALNLLNFSWSVGAVACPFLVSAAARSQRIPLMLGIVAGVSLLVAVGIAAMPSHIVEPAARETGGSGGAIHWRHPALPALALLFFVYVGTENGFGLWIATYSKSLGNMSLSTAVMTPSFFYISLMIGRWLVSQVLRSVDDIRLVKVGLLVSCAGMAGLVLSHAFVGVVVSACVAGLGLAGVYPITISLLSREFGRGAARAGSLMFTLSNIGGGLLPWVVGVSSTHFGTLKAGLAVPLIGSAVMYVLYLRNWERESVEMPA
jgi:MFS transporter, FHS family, glucose/mannose:H+ symporter